jgi:hypothetical protein
MSVSFRRSLIGAVLLSVLALSLIFIGGAASPTGEGSAATPTSATPSTITIDITIADGRVEPSGEEIDAPVGQGVILNVSSDVDDELHAHMGLDGFGLTVWAGQSTSGGFWLRGPGTFVVESHRLGKTIVILNVH